LVGGLARLVVALRARRRAGRARPGTRDGGGAARVVLTGPAQTAAIADYLARNGAGQCGPCRFGLPAVADVLTDLVELRARRRHTRRLERILGEIAGRGACHHPDGAVRMVASALHTFAADVHAHLRGGGCRPDGSGDFFPVPEGA
jgi:hypothetical protein